MFAVSYPASVNARCILFIDVAERASPCRRTTQSAADAETPDNNKKQIMSPRGIIRHFVGT